jgi:hypothetical protein
VVPVERVEEFTSRPLCGLLEVEPVSDMKPAAN